jgi:hypothetical protein
MTKDEALKKAFKQAFQLGQDYWYQADHEYVSQNKKSDVTRAKFEQLMEDAIKEALAQPEQEPVACVEYIPCCTDQTCQKCKAAIKPELVCVCGAVWEGQELIYTTPQRTWVGLTPEELDEMFSKTLKGKKLVNWVAQAIEAKLKEKNT